MVVIVPVDGEQEGRYQYSGGLGSISLTESLGRRDHLADMMTIDDMIWMINEDTDLTAGFLEQEVGRRV